MNKVAVFFIFTIQPNLFSLFTVTVFFKSVSLYKKFFLYLIPEKIHYYTSGALKFLIPLSLVSIAVYLSKRVKNNRKDIILDRDL